MPLGDSGAIDPHELAARLIAGDLADQPPAVHRLMRYVLARVGLDYGILLLVGEDHVDGFDRLIGADLSHLQALFPADRDLLERTRSLIAPLSEMSFPLVLEHGDLSHPNLLIGPGERVGVIDWEQAELRGMPAVDLFFFLAYVGRAMGQTRSTGETLRAIDQAFFGRRSWAFDQ